MKYISLFIAFCCISMLSYSQGGAAGISMDTIILVSGKKIIGKIQNVGSTKISYFKEDPQKIEEITRKQIHKIKYSTGRVEAFNSMAFQMVADNNYQAVIITDKPEEVEGLYEYGKVEAKSGTNSRTAKAAERNARIRLQRKAAAMGALYVLITKSETRGGYKEVPTHLYEGIAYGVDPPKDGKKQ